MKTKKSLILSAVNKIPDIETKKTFKIILFLKD
jgi:hypothetical protein